MSNRTMFLIVMVVVTAAVFGVSCTAPDSDAPAADSAADMVRPGDKIGDAVLRKTADESETEPALYSYCKMRLAESSEENLEECLAPIEPRYFLGIGVGESNPEKLESVWESLAWEISIDGKRIDLDSFGTFDVSDGRFWDLVLDNPAKGSYKIEQIITVDGEPSEEYGLTLNLTLVEPDVAALAGKADSSLPALSADVPAGQDSFYSKQAGLDYLVYVPDDYGEDPSEEWPLIMYLHGAGPRYSLDIIKGEALPQKLEDEADFPFIVVSPRAFEGEYEIWTVEKTADGLDILLQEIQTTLAVDPARIYLTGESAGGNGSWEMGLRYLDRFAALVPVMGYVYPFDEAPENICDLKDVPVWAFHGAQDEVVPLDAGQLLVDTLQACGGDVKFTVYPDKGHDIEMQVYDTPELYEWLLSQRLE